MELTFTKKVFATTLAIVGFVSANLFAQSDFVSSLKSIQNNFQNENPISIVKNNASSTHARFAAAPPVNDNCANATILTAGATCTPTTGTFAEATQSIAPDSCSGLQTVPTAFDVWYTFIATSTNQTIQFTPAGQTPGVIVLYSTCGGTPITCANPTNYAAPTILKATLTIGTSYIVRVYPFSVAIPTPAGFTICVFNTPNPPANDDCSGAITITESTSATACSPTTVNTVGATKSTQVASCSTSSIDDDVWYSFTATSAAVTVKASNKSFTGGVGFVLYTGSCTGTQSSECQFNAPGDSLTFNGLTIGTTYFLRTFTNGTTNTGTYNICLYPYIVPTPPVNDNCATATSLTPALNCTPTTGTFQGATQSSAPDSCSGLRTLSSALDVWYKFNALSVNQTIQVTPGAQSAAVIVLYPSCGGTAITCANPTAFGGATKLNAAGLTIGTSYIVRVYPYSAGPPTDNTFTICVFNTPPAPANDDCANAITAITFPKKVGSTFNTTANTVNATKDLAPSCAPSSSDDNVWYKFTATSTTMTFLADSTIFTGGFTSVGAALFEGSCSGKQKGCSASTHLTGDSLAFDTLTIGTTYYLTTFTQGTAATGTFKFKVYGSGTATGINDLNVSLNNLSIYPNPSTGLFTLSFNTTVEKSTVTVYDIIGSVVKQEVIASNGNVNYLLDLSNQENGTYFVKTQSGNGFSIKKITINK